MLMTDLYRSDNDLQVIKSNLKTDGIARLGIFRILV